MNVSDDRAKTAEIGKQMFNRRRFLRGAGALMALPLLESLLPRGAASVASGAEGAAGGATPLRMGFVYFPNGAIPASFWPSTEGAGFELPSTLQPLEALRNKIQVLGGLDAINATPGPDGAGDHARASGAFLTGVRVKKTAGADIHAGVSIDQVAANHVGHLTRFPSLELTCDSVHKSGNCDSGYSCAYQYNLSWQSPVTPIAPEPNPRLVFERMFGEGAPGQRQAAFKLRQEQQKSILDFVMDDAKSLDSQLGSRDRQKLDEYLTDVRQIEQRIEETERHGQTPDPDAPTPEGIPAGYEQYIQIMFSVMALAFQTDSTRISTFLIANEGSNRAFPEIGIPEGHHYLSHHQGQQEMISKVSQIDLFYMKQFGGFLQKLNSIHEANGKTLLDNSMIVYGSGNSDGNRHTHVNLPIILAGTGGGTLSAGRYKNYGGQPLTNLYLSMIDRMGVQGVERFGDSTGRLKGV